MNLWEYADKHVKITSTSGWAKEGKADLYTSALDNPEEVASICVGDTIFFEDEIANIEIISAAVVQKVV